MPRSLMSKQIVKGGLKKPPWLVIKAAGKNENYQKVRASARNLSLSTVCESAFCPNIGECWAGGTATFMIMGNTCTRACRFCAVNHGKPQALDKNEPKKLADAIKKLGINYAVITSVDRDDLPDFGAEHFAQCIKYLRKSCPKLLIEILVPDFQGNKKCIEKIISAKPHVFGHNIETVPRLQKYARDIRANYKQSLFVLEYVKKLNSKIFTKSSIMVGIGENQQEVFCAMRDLRKIGVDFLTIGQYLRPTAWNIPVKEYVTPEQFEWYRIQGLKLGFKYVASGPFVRSSYKAGELFIKNVLKNGTD